MEVSEVLTHCSWACAGGPNILGHGKESDAANSLPGGKERRKTVRFSHPLWRPVLWHKPSGPTHCTSPLTSSTASGERIHECGWYLRSKVEHYSWRWPTWRSKLWFHSSFYDITNTSVFCRACVQVPQILQSLLVLRQLCSCELLTLKGNHNGPGILSSLPGNA